MLIPQPYLLFPGDVTDPLAAKTARGVHIWRPEQYVGEIKLPGCTVSLGLDELDIPGAKARRENAGPWHCQCREYLPQHCLNIRCASPLPIRLIYDLHHKILRISS